MTENNNGHALAKRDETAILEKVIIGGDLKELSSAERVTYYIRVCDSIGVNPYTQPFTYIVLNNRLTLYANKSCTDQLRAGRKINAAIVSRERIDDVYVVTARATTPDGRQDESIGAVSIANLKGDALANALMKAETKAKRRVTLSISGLSMLDETEIETIKDAKPVPVSVESYPTDSPQDTPPIEAEAHEISTEQEKPSGPYCHGCGIAIEETAITTNGKELVYSQKNIIDITTRSLGAVHCIACYQAEMKKRKAKA